MAKTPHEPSTAPPQPSPPQEGRLRTLEQYDVLDAPPTEAFDRVTALARRLLDMPVSLVNVVDDEAQWCLSTADLGLDQVSLDASFCVHTIEQGDVMVVEDAREDPRFADNPLVTGTPHLRFYAGAPLVAPNGYRLGALCVLDDQPRSLTAADRQTLSDLADIVVDEMQLRHYASGLKNEKQAAEETSEHRRRVLESITDGFFAVDEDWTFTYVNAQAEALLERPREELLGRTVWDEFPEAVGSAFQKRYETAIEERTTVEFTEYYAPLNRWFEVKAFPFEDGLSVYFDDATERMEARESLRRERNLTEAIMDTSVAAIVTVDAEGRISFANAPAGDILGANPEALEGSSHLATGTLRTLDGTELADDERPFRRVWETGEPIADERYVLERPDGETRSIRVNGAPLRAPGGAVRQVVFSIDDITDQVGHERELRAAKEEAERASRLKSSFLANMSHDVRAPLSSILSLTELLAMEVPAEHQERIRLIERSSYRLLDTIDSVLDLSKLESGTVEPEYEPVDLRDELLGTAEIFQPQAREADLTLETDVEDPLTAEMDPTMLHRITDNLLSNAIKFTEPGGTVTLRARGTDGAVILEVEDTGVGIDEDFLPDLFESFAQGTDQAGDGGSGLGLAITKRLTEVMGGTIEAESEKGVGTTFTVRLPRER